MFLIDIVRFCCIFSLYMYHGLVTFLLIHCISSFYICIYIYMMYVLHLISHVLFLFSLYTHVSSCIQLVYVSHLMPQ